LLAESFKGKEIPILDCTIRDGQGKIQWDLPKLDIKTILNDARGIYSAKLSDYDDDRVHPFGVKLILELAEGRARTDRRVSSATTGMPTPPSERGPRPLRSRNALPAPISLRREGDG
jgi:hypothetical protein